MSGPSRELPLLAGPESRIGLALGAGSAKGWAHVGVIRALAQLGIRPEVVCGTSAGALVGAAYAMGQIDGLEAWLLSLDKQQVALFYDFTLGGGLLRGRRLFDSLANFVADRTIEEMERPFGAVATDLESGAEVWLRRGSAMAAVRASTSVPGLLRPVWIEDRWCVDGALVNPVPVSLCRALGATLVIAVDVFGQGANQAGHPLDRDAEENGEIGLRSVLERSLNIAQAKLTAVRLQLEPADLVLTPQVGYIGPLELYRAAECFEAGRRAVVAREPEVLRLAERFYAKEAAPG